MSGHSLASEEDFQALFGEAKNKIKEKDEDFSNLQESCEAENQELQNEIFKLHKKCISTQSEVENKRRAISNSQKEIREIEAKLKEVGTLK